MATTQQQELSLAPPSPTELKATELSRWLQHKHDGTSIYIKKDLVDAGMREKDRMLIWTDGSTFANSRTLVNHILAHSPETINDLHASSLAMQKVLKAGAGITRQPQPTIIKPKLKRHADPTAQAQRKASVPRKKMSLSVPAPYQEPATAQLNAAIPGLPLIHAPAAPAAQDNHRDPPPSKAGLAEKLLSGEYQSDRESTRGTIGLVLEGLESSPPDLNMSCLKQLVQQHKVQGELQAKARLLVEDYDRAVEVGAARTLSGLQSAEGLGGGGEAARSDEDLRQDIEALSELLASNHKFTPAYLATLEKQKAGLEEELQQRGEQVKTEADFRLQRIGLIEEVKELLLAEDKHLEEVILAAAGLRKLFEYL